MPVRKKSADTANLDSFLDTLFNVAGILVIIIALTQITAKEQIKKTVETDQTGGVSMEQLARAEKELEQLTRNFLAGQVAYRSKDEELADLTDDFANLQTKYGRIESEILSVGPYTPPSILQGNVNELKKEADDLNQTLKNTGVSLELVRAFKDWSRLQAQLRAAQEKLDGNRTEFTDLTDLLVNRNKDEVASRQNIADLKRGATAKGLRDRLQKIENDKKDANRMLQELEAKLDNVKDDLARADKQVILRPPDPRPRKEDIKIVNFILRYGAVYDGKDASALVNAWRENQFLPWLELNRRRFTSIPQLQREMVRAMDAGILDGPILQNKHFDLDVSAFPKTKIMPRRGGGEPAGEALKDNSIFMRSIRRLDKENQMVNFWVYSDSFKLYIGCRNEVEGQGVEAGWGPLAPAEFIYFGGDGVPPD